MLLAVLLAVRLGVLLGVLAGVLHGSFLGALATADPAARRWEYPPALGEGNSFADIAKFVKSAGWRATLRPELWIVSRETICGKRYFPFSRCRASSGSMIGIPSRIG